jgi:hypothetical protein
MVGGLEREREGALFLLLSLTNKSTPIFAVMLLASLTRPPFVVVVGGFVGRNGTVV